MARSERRRVETYREGNVKLYESVKWITTSLKYGLACNTPEWEEQVGADSVPEFLYPHEDIP